MKTTKVVQLGLIRDLLAEWDLVRKRIAAGKIGGFQTVFCDSVGELEEVFHAGLYKEDVTLATKAALRISAARMMTEDKPLRVRPEQENHPRADGSKGRRT